MHKNASLFFVISVVFASCSDQESMKPNQITENKPDKSQVQKSEPNAKDVESTFVDFLAAKFYLECHLKNELKSNVIARLAGIENESFNERLARGLALAYDPTLDEKLLTSLISALLKGEQRANDVLFAGLAESIVEAYVREVAATKEIDGFLLSMHSFETKINSETDEEHAQHIIVVLSKVDAATTDELVQSRKKVKALFAAAIKNNPDSTAAFVEAKNLAVAAETDELRQSRKRVKTLIAEAKKNFTD